jgi:hypothetical protein
MPRTPTLLLAAALAAVCCGARADASTPQQPPAHDSEQENEKLLLSTTRDAARAEELYQQGETLMQSGRADTTAVSAFGDALKLYLSLYTGRSIPPPSTVGPAGYRASMRERLKHAPECVERYLRLGGQTEFERSQLEAFRGQVLGLREESESSAIFLGPEVDEHAHITSKPEPGFTEEARRNNVWGVIRLRAVLAADGTVKHALILKGLPHGLSEQSVIAAERMKFTPALKNGRRVSQFVVLEYNFNTY